MCCDAHLELFYLKVLKPRLDAIDSQLELLIQAQERATREAQAKIDAMAGSINASSDTLDSTQKQ